MVRLLLVVVVALTVTSAVEFVPVAAVKTSDEIPYAIVMVCALVGAPVNVAVAVGSTAPEAMERVAVDAEPAFMVGPVWVLLGSFVIVPPTFAPVAFVVTVIVLEPFTIVMLSFVAVVWVGTAEKVPVCVPAVPCFAVRVIEVAPFVILRVWLVAGLPVKVPLCDAAIGSLAVKVTPSR